MARENEKGKKARMTKTHKKKKKNGGPKKKPEPNGETGSTGKNGNNYTLRVALIIS